MFPVEISRPLLFGAASLALVSAAFSAYLALSHRPAAGAPQAGACACDDAALKREIEDLRREIRARSQAPSGDTAKRVEARLAALETKSGVAPPPPDPSGAPTATTTVLRDGTPRIQSFDVPSPAVKVQQSPEGSLSVINTDPSLTGKVMIITGHTEDGAAHPMSILIPAPSN